MKSLALFPDNFAGEIGHDHSQALGFHIKANEMAEGGVEAQLHAAPTATLADVTIRGLAQKAFFEHVVDEIADARIADIEFARQSEAAGRAPTMQRLKQAVPLG